MSKLTRCREYLFTGCLPLTRSDRNNLNKNSLSGLNQNCHTLKTSLIETSKESLSSGVAEHFMLSQLARIKAFRCQKNVAKEFKIYFSTK